MEPVSGVYQSIPHRCARSREGEAVGDRPGRQRIGRMDFWEGTPYHLETGGWENLSDDRNHACGWLCDCQND